MSNKVASAINSIILEVVEISRVRNIGAATALASIIKEQQRKWNAVCRYIGYEDMNDLFIKVLKNVYPDIYNITKNYI